MKKTRLSFRKSRWQKSDTNEIKPDYNNAFTVLGVLLTELANAAAAVLLTVCAVSVVNTTVSHVRCPYYVYVWLFIFSVISGFINRLTSLDTRKWVRHAINTGLLLVFLLGVFIANWQAAGHIKAGFLYVKGRYLELINVYYGTSFVCQKGDKAFAGAFVGFVSFIVMLLLVTLAVQIKRRRILTLFPTLMLVVQLCIGKSPSVSEVVMLTLCTLWCLIADGNARTVAGYDVNGSAQGNEALRIAAAFLYMAAVSAIRVTKFDSSKDARRRAGSLAFEAGNHLEDTKEKNGWYEKARKYYETLCQDETCSYEDEMNYALVLQALEQYSDSNVCLRKMREEYPDDYKVLMWMCYNYLGIGNQKGSMAEVESDLNFAYSFCKYLYSQDESMTGGSDEDMEKLNEAILGERGYYDMLLKTEKERKSILRFNLQAFKNNYNLVDLSKMKLTYFGIKVGTCGENHLSIDKEFDFQPAEDKTTAEEIVEGEKSVAEEEKELDVYDIVLAGVVREED